MQEASGMARTPLEPVVLAATLALIAVVIVETDTSGAWYTAAVIANWVISGRCSLSSLQSFW